MLRALTDAFSLGLILASIACGLNLNEPSSLETLVGSRRNLFALNPRLHPVIAQAILRLTELDRRRRPQDLTALLHTLENYRDQPVARRGESYIIQGPPGTGKSQTITNLIADFVARGKRVLFVCEKRAAIDVVFARLKQCGLGPLCSLIHDSQTDKKEFILDLKQTYELFITDTPTGSLRRPSPPASHPAARIALR